MVCTRFLLSYYVTFGLGLSVIAEDRNPGELLAGQLVNLLLRVKGLNVEDDGERF